MLKVAVRGIPRLRTRMETVWGVWVSGGFSANNSGWVAFVSGVKPTMSSERDMVEGL